MLGAPVSEYLHVFKEASSYSVTINNIKNNGYSSLNIYHGLSTVLATSQKSTYIILTKQILLSPFLQMRKPKVRKVEQGVEVTKSIRLSNQVDGW